MHRNNTFFTHSLYLIMLLFTVLLCACAPREEAVHFISPAGESNSVVQNNSTITTTTDSSIASQDSSTDHSVEAAPNTIVSEAHITESNPNTYIHLLALGDNLTHPSVVKTGLQEDGSYDFSFEFEPIVSLLEQADIKVINQETPLAGNHRGFSGFPHFNSPTEIGDSIAKYGFNVVLTATNHAFDQDIDGIEEFVHFWESNHPELLVVGTHTPDRPHGDIPILTIENTSIAILNYTYGANLEVIPTQLPTYLDFLCPFDAKSGLMNFTKLRDEVITDIQAARDIADYVIVCPHWGTEYQTTPSKYQLTFAQQIADAGADLIIGTHPHVVQPVDKLTAADGREVLCYYSLGNYVSGQRNIDSMLEALAWVTLEVTPDGQVSTSFAQSGAIPMVCQYTKGVQRIESIYPLEEYTEELAHAHGINNHCSGFSAAYLQELSTTTLGSWTISFKECSK